MPDRVGVLGGSFDPVHYGHLVAGEEARFALELAEVIFVPAGRPPHKLRRIITPAEHRWEMLSLAIASNQFFRASRVDIDRAGPHYTVDTIALLQRELGSKVEIDFIVGLDSLLEMASWREPERLLQMCHLVAVTRPGWTDLDLSKVDPRLREASERIRIIPIPLLDISASGLRERVAAGRPIKYQLPEAVEDYIYRHGLYRAR